MPPKSRTPFLLSRRWVCTSTAGKPVSPHVNFYKEFTRPIAKVVLMSAFVYQLSYWTWVKLEKEEVRREKRAEIGTLEKEVERLTGKKPPGKSP